MNNTAYNTYSYWTWHTEQWTTIKNPKYCTTARASHKQRNHRFKKNTYNEHTTYTCKNNMQTHTQNKRQEQHTPHWHNTNWKATLTEIKKQSNSINKQTCKTQQKKQTHIHIQTHNTRTINIQHKTYIYTNTHTHAQQQHTPKHTNTTAQNNQMLHTKTKQTITNDKQPELWRHTHLMASTH